MVSTDLGFLSKLLGFRIKQANAVLLTEGEKKLREIGISAQQFPIMTMIATNPGIIQSRLVDTLYVTRSSCSELVEQLIKQKLVIRTPIDRRSNGLSLTSSGEKIFRQAKKRVLEHEATLTTHMTDTEISTLVKLLAKFSNQE